MFWFEKKDERIRPVWILHIVGFLIVLNEARMEHMSFYKLKSCKDNCLLSEIERHLNYIKLILNEFKQPKECKMSVCNRYANK